MMPTGRKYVYGILLYLWLLTASSASAEPDGRERIIAIKMPGIRPLQVLYTNIPKRRHAPCFYKTF